MSKVTKGEFRILQDDDGHWYLIPYNQQDEFNAWVEQWAGFENFGSAEAYDGDDFDCHRIDGPHALKILEYEDES